METPTNPLLNIGDIEAIASIAHEAGALLVVDNTFATPYLQTPLTLGADVVLHSTTKYAGGHSDVVGGAVVVRDLEIAEQVAFHQNAMGAVAGPFDAWLVLRGLKTLGVRMDRHCDNAEKVVEYLTRHEAVSHVYYPGLPDHPGHDIAARQMKRFGGIVSFRVTGGEQHAVDVCGRAEVFTLGESLGGVESLIEHPGRMTHASVAGTAARGTRRPDPSQRRHRDDRRPARRPRPCPRLTHPRRPICVDFGSTFTKAALVDLAEGRIVAQASHATTIETDVLDGYDACLAALREQDPRADGAEVLACSSAPAAGCGSPWSATRSWSPPRPAAGSPSPAVAGWSRSSPLRVVCLTQRVWRSLGHTTRPDVVLLTGGTDGGNTQVIVDAARGIVAGGWTGPVVVAGNVDARPEVEEALRDNPYVVADNVVPRIGVLAPDSARAAIREMFLSHVIGGKHLSKRADFTAMVTGATPDVVLTGVELLARGWARSPGRGRRGRRRRRRRHHRRALGGRARPRGGEPLA